MEDLRLALMCGTDIPIPGCSLVIHQPTLKEISYIGEQDFFSGVQCLCINKSMFVDETLLEATTNFQVFMTIMSQAETIDKKRAVQQVLLLFFPQAKVLFTPRSLILNVAGVGNVIIDETNFEHVQYIISEIVCTKTGPMDQQGFNPADAKAKEIADKIMRGRQKVAEQKGQTNVSVLTQYLSILTIGTGSMSLSELMNLTIYQLYDLIERYMLYTSWDLDIRSRMAGAKIEGQPENWMKNLH